MPVYLAGHFSREDKLSADQQMDILTCRLVMLTHWTPDVIESIGLEWAGKLISYDDGISMMQRAEQAKGR